ncbi:polysaccharide biosynthesis C-terminal domain-containing protein [Flaviflexus equikiangi]|uniref:NAD-dependent epimerase/dehydratase family protein n=1 Tax=Flaviflexus equikiangi TaxID=2758573 RepID=A0ABS2TIP3_9ACTO|nr:NAD-dependent epimerase/dehydratase family protein [Flaviflexus equikiangi]MBM9433406.1 NAD-dependent epimerase/dehydratase family protein [Flaviflexus equikiangi]
MRDSANQTRSDDSTTTVLTGADGFLGWHTRAALHAAGSDALRVRVGSNFDAHTTAEALEGSARLIHIAGVNRGSESEVADGNILFANQISQTLRQLNSPPPSIVFANSTQAGNGTVYGESKARAADILHSTAADLGLEFTDVRLPNLFGEHGKPFYNAVTSTFCQLLVDGEMPQVLDDKELTLLHAQNAADLLTGSAGLDLASNLAKRILVSELLQCLKDIADIYSNGEIPDVSDPFVRDLFNTYRSYVPNGARAFTHVLNSDSRGTFVETMRSHGGQSQSSFSTTAPDVTRGQHFHRRKIERFTVIEGEAVIAMRKLFSDEVIEFKVSGDQPTSIDMPTLWPHKIVNIGKKTLLTSFWIDELFDPTQPDTVRENV